MYQIGTGARSHVGQVEVRDLPNPAATIPVIRSRQPLWSTFVARLLVALTVLPAALLTWLALGVHAPRADFVVAYQEPRTLDPHRVRDPPVFS